MTRTCVDCGRDFYADETWKVRCLNCYKRMKREEEQTTWQDEARRRAPTAVDGYVRQAHRLVQDAYLAGQKAAQRDVEEAEERGYVRGYGAAAAEHRSGPSTELLRTAIALCHPDRHPPERFQAANDTTARLLELLNGRRGEAA